LVISSGVVSRESDESKMPQPAVLDSRGLRGLAHPMRVQILDLLDLDGPATATMLADSLGVRSGSTSWHLLKLAEAGLVEEVPQPRGRRGRWWCSSGPWSIDHADYEDDGELADASSVVLGAVVSQHLLRATQFLNEDWPERWRRAWILTTETRLRLDPASLTAMRAELWAVIERYRSDPSTGAEAEAVLFQMQGFPRRAHDQV
jgi:DNA-binding transcriptional ArsR family regulator